MMDFANQSMQSKAQYQYAQNAAAQAYPNDALAPARTAELPQIRGQICDLADRVWGLANDIGMLGDEIFGPQPEPVSNTAQLASAHSQLASLNEQIDRLRHGLLTAEEKFRRLRALA